MRLVIASGYVERTVGYFEALPVLAPDVVDIHGLVEVIVWILLFKTPWQELSITTWICFKTRAATLSVVFHFHVRQELIHTLVAVLTTL